MTYFECSECGQMANLQEKERSTIRQPCPQCDERTVWTEAFADEEEGVSF